MTASRDGSAACWDVTNGTKLRAFVDVDDAVFGVCVDFNTDIDILVTGSIKTVNIWSFAHGNILCALEFTCGTGRIVSQLHMVKIWGKVGCLMEPVDSFHILAHSGVALVDYEIRLSTGIAVLEKEDILLVPKNIDLFSGFHVDVDDSSLKVLYLEYDSSGRFRIVTETIFECIAVGGRRKVTQSPIRRIFRLPVFMNTVSDLMILRSGDGLDIIVEFNDQKHRCFLSVVGHNSDETSNFIIDLPKR